MAPIKSQEYEALPVEEKVEDELAGAAPKSRKRRSFFVLLFCFLSFTSLLVVVGFKNLWAMELPISHPENLEDPEEFLTRALSASNGTQYLLGVGKADITG